jgi:hypothetical protein
VDIWGCRNANGLLLATLRAIDFRTLARAGAMPVGGGVGFEGSFFKGSEGQKPQPTTGVTEMIRLRTLCTTSHPGRARLPQIHHPRHGARVRCAHDRDRLITLIDAVCASQKLRLSPTSLELGARHEPILDYRIGEVIRFDRRGLDVWARKHRIDEFISVAGECS